MWLWLLTHKSEIPLRYRLQMAWEDVWVKRPWIANEGEATARVIDMSFLKGFPMEEDYASTEEAVAHLQQIWNILDDWGDGRRINVIRAGGKK